MGRDNFYTILELDPDELDWVKIQDQITQKTRDWSKLKLHPTKAGVAQRCLEQIPEIRRVLGDETLRKEEADACKKEIKLQEKILFAELDKAIAMCSLKGYVSEKEVTLLANKFKFATPDDIRKRIKVTIKPDEKKTTKAEGLDKSLAKNIRDGLDILNKESLYDFLGLKKTSSIKTLLAETNLKDLANKSISNKTAEVTAIGQLIGHCLNTFKTEQSRAKYDVTLAREGLIELDKSLDIAGIAGKIQVAQFDQLMKQGLSFGLAKDEAREYIQEYAQQKKWAIEVPKDDGENNWMQCGICGIVNQKTDVNCIGCQFPLNVDCPQCGKRSPSTNRACGQCGFALGDMPNAEQHFKLGYEAHAKSEYASAKLQLQRGLVYWPKHPKAQKTLDDILLHEGKIITMSDRLGKAITGKQYYEARTLLRQLKNMAPTHADLINESTVEQKIRGAEALVEHAKSASNTDAALESYLKALDLCEDCQTAMDGVRKSPPDSPGQVVATPTASAIALKWSPSSSKYDIAYCLIRNARNQPQSIGDGTMLTETNQLSFDDTTAEPGCLYYYGVFAKRKSIPSRCATLCGPVMRTADIGNLSATATDGRIDFTWTAPPNLVQIEVWRKEGGEPTGVGDGKSLSGVRLDGISDGGLRNETAYYYLFVAVFKDQNGRLVKTKGISRTVTPTAPPAPVSDLRILPKGNMLELLWTQPVKGIVNLYLCTRKPTVRTGESRPVARLSELGETIPVLGKGRTEYRPTGQDQLWIIPVTLNGDSATLGTPVSHTSVEDVFDLRGSISGGKLYLDWTWPTGAREALVAFGHQSYSTSPDDQLATLKTITPDLYSRQSGFVWTDPGKKNLFVTVYIKAEKDGEPVYSMGAKCFIANGDLQEIFYEIKLTKSLFGSIKSAALHLTTKEQNKRIPDMVLVKKNGSLPIRKNDGSPIFDVKVGRMAAGSDVINIPVSQLSGNFYAKLFFIDNQDTQGYRLMGPAKEKLKLF